MEVCFRKDNGLVVAASDIARNWTDMERGLFTTSKGFRLAVAVVADHPACLRLYAENRFVVDDVQNPQAVLELHMPDGESENDLQRLRELWR